MEPDPLTRYLQAIRSAIVGDSVRVRLELPDGSIIRGWVAVNRAAEADDLTRFPDDFRRLLPGGKVTIRIKDVGRQVFTATVPVSAPPAKTASPPGRK